MSLKVLLLLSLFAVIEIPAILPRVRLLTSFYGKPQNRFELTYSFGSPRPDEILVHNRFSKRVDYNYPTNVVGFSKTIQDSRYIINRAEVISIQSTVSGDARITQGDIGQSFLHVVVNAYNTMHFQFNLKVYAVRAH
ncbi:uncharacterized protein LOC115623154 [Scaptodrosophila lebanonensis]|uniref:Uncharacterized protein LOC115623154 n=1 Tax=Drosophila lebanonensis TaxID=7225 RepID=A0A6J2TDM7_DROLE|nr:uncharacterized protein LOC115623154 [Scaptodrosophila lebanonensis]